MRTLPVFTLLAGLALEILTAAAQTPADQAQAFVASTNKSAGLNRPITADARPLELATLDRTNIQPVTARVAVSPNHAKTLAAQPNPVLLPNGEKGLKLNFRGVALQTVLDYLSKAAGLIVNLETPVTGKVDVWSDQPVSVSDAINLLDSALNKNGFAAIHQGRTLTIVTRATARKRAIPVRTGNRPEAIPQNDQMVTQIIPVRFASATAMTKDLQPLLPEHATLTANESGNALVLTDIQSDVRRMVQLVQALDTSIAGISSVRVFRLQYADAKDLVSEIKELFPTSTGTSASARGGGNPFPAMFSGGPGGGGPGGDFGPTSGGAATGEQSEARQAASRVTAVADERTNSLVVSAPESAIPVIEQLVRKIDGSAQNITRIRAFRLKNADPVETADLLSSVFPDDSKSDNNRSPLQFGPPGFPGVPSVADTTQSTTSNRARQKARVSAVADQRTATLIVSASIDVMPTIEKMIAQLDADPAKRQKLFVYTVKNADVANVRSVLQDMFGTTMQSSTSASQNSDALSTRQSQAAQSVGQALMQQSTSRNGVGGATQ